MATPEKPKHIVIDARIRRTSTGRPVARLLENLPKLDTYNHYTLLLQPDDDWRPTSSNYTVMPCPFPQFSFNPLDQIKFAWQLYKLRPDLVHFTMTQQPLFYFGHIVTMTHDTTMYTFVRRGSTPLPVYKLKMALYKFLVWWSHVKSSRIIVPTKTVAKEFARLQPFTKDKTVVIYEAGEMPNDLKPARPKKVDGDFILYVGTAFPHKNLYKLVEAFDSLQAERPELKLVLVGKREKHYEELEAWAKNRPSYKNIVFTGFVSDAELKWLYENTKAYVFASLSEGFGLPPLEAMAYGAPVVSSDASCLPEVNGDAAYYFDATNPEDIALKVGEVLDKKSLREKLIKNGYAQIKKYSWEKMTRQTLDLYKKVLKI